MGRKELSQIDKLFYKLMGYCPAKAGAAYEIISDAVYAIVKGVNVKHNQFIKTQYCDTKFQLDGLAQADNGDKQMIECKDYTISNSPVGRGELQTLQGALTDLDVTSGVFTSATDFTEDAKEYAKGTYKNPKQVGIDLMHVRPSQDSDRKGRIEKICCTINARGLDFKSNCIKPIFGKGAKEIFEKQGLIGKPLSLKLEYIFNSKGEPQTSIHDYTLGLNKLVKLDDHTQTKIQGKDLMDDACISLADGTLCPIEGMLYDIPIYDFNYEFTINQKGEPVILVKSQDGTTDKLITDKQLKEYIVKVVNSVSD